MSYNYAPGTPVDQQPYVATPGQPVSYVDPQQAAYVQPQAQQPVYQPQQQFAPQQQPVYQPPQQQFVAPQQQPVQFQPQVAQPYQRPQQQQVSPVRQVVQQPVQYQVPVAPVVKSRPPQVEAVQAPMMAQPQIVAQAVQPQMVRAAPQQVYQAPPQPVVYQAPVNDYVVPDQQPVVYQEEQPQFYEPQFVESVPVSQPQYVEPAYEAQPEQYYAPDVYVPQTPPQQAPVVVKSAAPQQYKAPPQLKQYTQPQPVKYVKSQPPAQQQPSYEPSTFFPTDGYYDDIEPTETDIGDGADLDEGTVTAAQQNYREPAPVITGDRLAKKDTVTPKTVKSGIQQVSRRTTTKQHVETSPRITTMPTKTVDQRNYTTAQQKQTAALTNQLASFDPFNDEQEFTHDDWKNIQKKIDKQYEAKLKQVGDDALKKLKMFQAEHKALLEKTQYLIDHSRIEDEEEEFAPAQTPTQQQRKTVNTDRNRFFTPQVQEQIVQDDYEYRKPTQLKNSAKGPGPQVIRKSQPAKDQFVAQSAPQQTRYQEQVPSQNVRQFVQQQQPQTYVPVQQQQPVRYIAPQSLQQQEQQFYQQQPPQYVPPQAAQAMHPPVRKSQLQQPDPYSEVQTPYQMTQQPKPVKRLPQQQYDTFSEQPARYQTRREDIQQPLSPRGSQPLVKNPSAAHVRTKSAPRNVMDQQAYSQPQRRTTRDRSANARDYGQMKQATSPRYPQSYQVKSKPQGSQNVADFQQEEEPICVLKVELDGGQNVQLLRVYEGQIPEEIVDEFGQRFNVSENAKHKLLSRIYEQIQN